MNVDMSLPCTPANARKLLAASKVIDVDLDNRIHDIAARDLLDISNVREQLPVKMTERLDTKMLEFCQYAADFNFRILFGSESHDESLTQSLIATMASNQRVFIVCSKSKERVAVFLIKNQIKFSGVKDGQITDNSADVVIVEEAQLTGDIIRGNRDRVVIMEPADMSPASSFHLLFGNVPNSIDPLLEFSKIIQSFYQSKKANNFVWWDDYRVLTTITAMHTGLSVNRLLKSSVSHAHALTAMRFTQFTPSKIAALLGVHLEFLPNM